MTQEALKLYGTTETPGTANNAEIMAWAKACNLDKVYTADSIAWCGLFAAIVAKRSGRSPVNQPLWARNWRNFGEPSPEASLGDILVFARGSYGHVGFYVGEDTTCYHVLGGNQSDKVCITRILKSRLIAKRRPRYSVKPASAKPYWLKSDGAISNNEA